MDEEKTIEEQVNELTKEQQDKIIKIGKIGLAVLLVGEIPMIILAIAGLCVLAKPPLGFDYSNYDKVFGGFVTLLIIAVLYSVGISAFIKIKYPYYSDAKWRYISKIRKQK